MRKEQILPLVLIIIDVASAVSYGIAHNWRMTMYWIAAAVLNIAVTF